MEIVLASASPRRRELLSLITEHFTVCPADADETLRDAPLGEEVTRLSRLKAEAVQAQYPNAVCIGSDTMVTIDGLRLGKPKDADEAASMLRRLRGRTHEVLPGLAVLTPDGGAHTLHTCTRVTFRGGRACRLPRHRRAARQGRRLRHPGPRRTAHQGHRGRLLQRHGSACGSALYHSARYSCGVSRIYLLKFHISVQHYERKIRFATTS